MYRGVNIQDSVYFQSMQVNKVCVSCGYVVGTGFFQQKHEIKEVK